MTASSPTHRLTVTRPEAGSPIESGDAGSGAGLTISSGAPLHPLDSGDHLLQPLIRFARDDPDRVVVLHRVDDDFVGITAAEFWAEILHLARGLIQMGIGPGDRVALMSATRLEWLLLDFAILAAGAVTVPIYDSSSAEQIEWIMTNSEASLLVVETSEMADRWQPPAQSRCPEVLSLDRRAIQNLAERGESVARSVVERRIASLSTLSPATLIYTSGTTARPKGCLLSHGNLKVNVAQLTEALGPSVGPSDRTIIFLPLAHILAKVSVLFCLDRKVSVAFATDMEHLPEELGMVAPTLLVGVPRVFEKVYNGAHHRAAVGGKGRIFDWAAAVAVRYSRERQRGQVRAWTRAAHAVADRLVYSKIVDGFGGSLRMAFSGGGPLGERLASFFDGAGVRIYEGYGLTETSPILSVNSTTAWRAGSVGQVVAGTTVRLGDDGEIEANGPQVFDGYWRNRAATEAARTSDGWLATGDQGEFDDDGFLYITGRLKDIIITAGGKNISPAPLEDRLRAHELVSQAVVVGEGRPFIAALITIDAEALAGWAAEQGISDPAPGSRAMTSAIENEIQVAVDEANKSVSRAESVRKFTILPADFTVDSGELTPTLKVRRAAVLQRYRAEVDQLYVN